MSAVAPTGELVKTACYHCGLAVPSGEHQVLSIDGRQQQFCCPGCKAVAGAIVDGGLANFYRFRTQANNRAGEAINDFAVYDQVEVQQEFVTHLTNDTYQAQLLIEGISCAACVWLIEHHLGKVPGVERVSVNANTHRCLLEWRPTTSNEPLRLSQLMLALSSIGYRPQPATQDQQQKLYRRENRQTLLRLGVAGIGMMQVGMVSIGLYAGAIQDMSENWQAFLRLISLLIATPIVFYSAQPFFYGAWRVIKSRHLSMDVPVALAIGSAYLASCWATLSGVGEVYFDSVAMFTFFLLLGRFLEMRVRHRNGMESGRFAQLLPLTACKVSCSEHKRTSQYVPVKSLLPGDWLRVNAGDVFACDGRVLEGHSGVVEAQLTGEPEPVEKYKGDIVVAGSLNQDSSLLIEVNAVGSKTQLSAIERLTERAQQDKPQQVALADKLAGYFVAAVLLVVIIVGLLWWYLDSERAFWISLSVLVVTCPCALSLATPTALTAAISSLRRKGLLVTSANTLQSLEKVTRVVFDKTGTLTLGRPQVHEVKLCGDLSKEQALAFAAALEAGSNHPIAQAFTDYLGQTYAQDLKTQTAAGVEGKIDGDVYRLGTRAYALGHRQPHFSAQSPGQWLLLANSQGPQAWIGLRDQVRPSAKAAVQAIMQRGIEVELLSGDSSSTVNEIAQLAGIPHKRGGVSPEQKLHHIQALQAQGQVVLMVGDGINDIPVLSGADVSVAMGSASELAQTRADGVLLSADLEVLPTALALAVSTRRIIRQNLSWAVAYNGLALPLAAAGWVPPYAAAIGMSMSSLIVVLNALRLNVRN